MTNDLRLCLAGCGQAAKPGDVYCTGCRDGADREAEIARTDGSDSLRT